MNLSSPKPTLLTLAALGSLILTFLVFGASIGNDFVTLDDALLILQNTDLRAINFETLSSIFTRFDPELYIPLTFFSYQIDYLLGGGYEPSMFHLTNVFLHAINVFFLFWLLKLLTGKTWLAGVLAALFCVHPLNVETIAWASARKDVLMTTYALGSLVTWLSYRASGKRWLYILSVILFGCSLLSKVSAVLLPLVLIGFDWATCQGSKQLNPCSYVRQAQYDIIKYLPFFVLSTIFGIVAIIGKSAVEGDISLFEKGLLGAKALLFYLIKFFLPFRLSILYPHESVISITDPWIFIGLITTLLILITVPLLYCFTSFFHKNKYHSRLLPLGITLFFLMLVPSFGNVMKDGVLYFASDRYMYLPMVGLLVVLAGILMRLITVRSLQQLKTILSACGVIIAILGMMSFNQSLKWRNTGTLFDHVLRSYPQSAMAHINLGAWYRDTGKHEQAIEQYEKALDLDPDRPRVVGLLAQATAENGETFGGLLLYTDAISMDPEDPELHYGLGSVHALRKEYAKAADAFRKTIALDPNASNALHNLGGMEYELGQKEEATKHYLLAFEYDPFSFESLYNAAVILGELGRKSEAIDIYLQLLELKPNHIKAHVNLGLLHLRNNQKSKGIRQLQKALELDPGNQPARKTLKAVGVNR